ncbi:MAG: DinB family protein [Dehalococcoidia bacterium]
MNAEATTYSRQLSWILDQVCENLEVLTEAQLNWRPPSEETNSAFAIASHIVGSTRVFALGFGCAQPVSRDRQAEFAASGQDARAIVRQLRGLAEEIRNALAVLPSDGLDRRMVPSQELWGAGSPPEMSARDAIVESIRHAGIHLGELRLTRHLAVRSA